ncbi:MAG: NAD-dependent epimerase/dehydratase family protein [Crocinitomicaceae bacterium]
MRKILIVGASGQIGTELVLELRNRFGAENVIASDVKEEPAELLKGGIYEQLDILNNADYLALLDKHKVTEVYLLAALLSATAEKNPEFAWRLNMEGLFNVLNSAKEGKIQKIFWPSSIAVFGPNTPRENTPQYCVMDPSTVYGLSKLAGERWCEYYFKKHGVDVRSIRYPGLISYGSLPGGGTTDYAVDIFYHAKAGKKYNCFLKKDTELPMMYMDDAIKATIDLMEVPSELVKIRSSYNIAGMSFTPEKIYAEIRKTVPNFQIEYIPDFRQEIADSWPKSINDNEARSHWGWAPEYDLSALTTTMLKHVDPSKLF